MARITNQRASLLTMMSNTVLFGVAAGLIGYCWLKYSFNTQALHADASGWWTMNEKLMLSTIALLLGGFFHSILIMYPEFIKRDEEISTSKKVEKELRKQVMNDSLTGIHNRRYFDESLKSYLDEFELVGAGLGLLVLDIDHFKSINDNFGHKIGDQVLKNIATILKENTRKLDVIARIGGEEFAVIAQCDNRDQLVKIAERYRIAIGGIVVSHENTAIKPTVSIGIATNKDSNIPQELLNIADGRMYQAKQNGRNQTAA
jgi:two-component system cell cycle response regulator